MRHSPPGQPSAQRRQQCSGASPPPWGTTSIMSGDWADQSPPVTPLKIPTGDPSPAPLCEGVALTVWMIRFEHEGVMLAKQRAQRRMSTAGRLQG